MEGVNSQQGQAELGIPNSKLQILYYNVRSVLPKLDELRLSCSVTRPHVVCIVETWLDDSVLDSELQLYNYCLVRLDRSRHGGGVLVYIRDDLSFNVAFRGPNNLELLGITLFNDKGSRLCLCVLYSPPSVTQLVLQQLFIFLQKINPCLYSNFVLVGDFNVNFLDPLSFLYHSLQNILSSFNLTQVVQEATRTTSDTATLIDLAMMSNPALLERCSVVPPLSNSDHNGVELVLRWSGGRTKTQPRVVWKYAQADFELACEKIQNINWNTLDGTDIDTAWQLWESTFMSVMEQCIPKGILPRKRKLPWVTAGIRRAMRKRNAAYRKLKSNPEFRVKYKLLRNQVTSQIRRQKRACIQSLSVKNAKEFWKTVKLLNGKGSTTIPVLSQDGQKVINKKEKANVLNHFFHSCFNTAIPSLTPEDEIFPELDAVACPQELFCSEEEVYELLAKLDPSKASGPDGISAKMLKGTASSIASVLTKLFNKSIVSGKLPLSWKFSNIVPIPKGSNSSEPSNYRPISLLSIVSKMLERIIYRRVTDHLESTCPPVTNQWGFLPGKSTVGAILSATHEWYALMEEGKEVGTVFFDLTKAFDSVPHQLLLTKLKELSLSPFLVKWIANYLTGRMQSVVIGGASSSPLPVRSGVPQGSVLGPLLFLVYVSDINDIDLSEGSKLVLYADDILLYRAIQSPEDYVALQHDINKLTAWTDTKLLKFNPKKCKTMLLSCKKLKTIPQQDLILNGIPLETVECFKYLGINIACDLSWTKHIQTITSKARRLVGLLYRQFYHCADTNTLRKLYISLVRPHMEYGSSVWDPFSAKDCDILEGVQRFASRVCLKTWQYEYPDMLKTLDLPALKTRRKIAKLMMMYKFVNNLAMFPESSSLFQPVHIPYSTRFTHNLLYHNIHAHTSRFMYSYFPSTLSLWNSLPYHIVSSTSVTSFKRSLDRYFAYT